MAQLPLKVRAQDLLRRHGPWFFPLLFALFMTQGLPLWAEDYDFWLAQASSGLLPLLQRLLSPVTQFASTWGAGDRPVIVSLYWLVANTVGESGAALFLIKSALFSAASVWLYRTWRDTLKVSAWVSGWLLALWLLAPAVTASLLHLSDFTLLTQIAFGALLLTVVRRMEKDPSAQANDFPKFAGLLFVALYLGAKAGADLRLLPIVLLSWCAIYRPKGLSPAYPAIFGGALVATLPWSASFFRKLPPFFPGAVPNEAWSPWSISRSLEFFWHDAVLGVSAPISVVGAVGFALMVLVAGLWGLRAAQGADILGTIRKRARDPLWGAVALWWLGVFLAAGALTRQNPFFDLKNGALLWVPTLLLWAPVLEATWRELRKFTGKAWVTPLWSVVFLVHLVLLARFSLWHRRDLGHTMVAVHKIYQSMDQKPAGSTLVLGPGVVSYGSSASASAAVRNRSSIGQWNEIARFPAGKTWVASWGATLDSSFVHEKPATGCAETFIPVAFDLIYPCSPADGAQLLRYVGAIPALNQAFQLERKGDLAGARQALESYLSQEPFNLGVLFNSSMYSYRMGDFVQMERAYEVLGAFLPQNASVLYNWGISKQGMQKWSDAIRRFEQADRLSPGNYGVLFNLAESWFRAGKPKRAQKIGEGLLKSFPNSAPLQQAIARWKTAP